MGTVYRAARDDGAFDREVALKLLRGTAHADRLDAERRVLARLEHDGIARLYDGGMLPDGRPYLVMELVEGARLTDAAAALGLDARLDLMLQVCDAVAFAHRHLVVHRDLKPSNIWVTAEGRVKLLDFGIAHLLDDDAGLTPGPARRLSRRPTLRRSSSSASPSRRPRMSTRSACCSTRCSPDSGPTTSPR